MAVTGVVLVGPLHSYYRPEHLEHVVAEMRRRGPPVLRAYHDVDAEGGFDVWHAAEGTHRLRAAKRLGLTPVLVPVPWRKSRAALERARISARLHGHLFVSVGVLV